MNLFIKFAFYLVSFTLRSNIYHISILNLKYEKNWSIIKTIKFYFLILSPNFEIGPMFDLGVNIYFISQFSLVS